jgi:two-component system, OmpR family, osmolarity sensor histidine kinase EnvZ
MRSLRPRTLLVRTFLLISLLIFVSVATWLTLFGLAEREPRAHRLGQLAVSVVNLTASALVAADPVKRLMLLRDLAEREGVHVYPAEPADVVKDLPDSYFFRIVSATARSQLGPGTRLAGSVNGQKGIWVSFSVGDTEDDDYWLMLPGEHAESDFPWHWLGWGGLSLALALFVAWLIVSRVTLPLRTLAAAARVVGEGGYPDPIAERGAIELRQLAVAFNRMSKNLKRIDAERAEILAGISHDLRTPLSRLRLEAEMSIVDDAARAAIVDDIEQMDAIIGQFLAYARGESAEPSELADVNAVVSRACALHARAANALRLDLGAVPATQIHPQALTRALSNLVENARKYGGDPIAVETRSEDQSIVIDVLDRGPGIPEGEIERLKRPFTRLDIARTDAHGTGLGLAIVERIARLHDGSLELLPRDGGGLVARLRLPMRD